MPVPQPHDNEAQDEFVARCAGDKTMNSDFPDDKQRVAVCYRTWRDRHAKKARDAVADLRLAVTRGMQR
jgi:hypothetical protein